MEKIELAGDEHFIVECKPQGGDSWDEEKIGGGAKDQLRCWRPKNGKTVEFPVLPGNDEALLCLCNSQVDESKIQHDLNGTWEVLAELIQMVMRRYGIDKPYEKLKDFTRGRTVTKESLQQLMESLVIPEAAKADLKALTPSSYIGHAFTLAQTVECQNRINSVAEYDLFKKQLDLDN